MTFCFFILTVLLAPEMSSKDLPFKIFSNLGSFSSLGMGGGGGTDDNFGEFLLAPPFKTAFNEGAGDDGADNGDGMVVGRDTKASDFAPTAGDSLWLNTGEFLAHACSAGLGSKFSSYKPASPLYTSNSIDVFVRCPRQTVRHTGTHCANWEASILELDFDSGVVHKNKNEALVRAGPIFPLPKSSKNYILNFSAVTATA